MVLRLMVGLGLELDLGFMMHDACESPHEDRSSRMCVFFYLLHIEHQN